MPNKTTFGWRHTSPNLKTKGCSSDGEPDRLPNDGRSGEFLFPPQAAVRWHTLTDSAYLDRRRFSSTPSIWKIRISKFSEINARQPSTVRSQTPSLAMASHALPKSVKPAFQSVS